MPPNNDHNLEIEPQEVEALLARQDDFQLVDVREDWELARGVLPQALHIPLSQFAEHLGTWNPDTSYVVYCEHGIRSLDVVMWLSQNRGIAARSMRGGFSEWHGPVESSPGSNTP